jgi:hypothetical protein
MKTLRQQSERVEEQLERAKKFLNIILESSLLKISNLLSELKEKLTINSAFKKKTFTRETRDFIL